MQAEDLPPESPRACALVLGIPITKEDFDHDIEMGSQKNFARVIASEFKPEQLHDAWKSYEPFAAYVADSVSYAKDQGVFVQTAATLADWVACLNDRPVVTLVAHCKEPESKSGPIREEYRVEFADGLYSPTEIIAAMPDSYSNTLDLSVCYSLNVLAPPTKIRFPACTVITNKRRAHVHLRLAMYRQALKLLKTGQYSFVESLTEVQLAILDEKKRH